MHLFHRRQTNPTFSPSVEETAPLSSVPAFSGRQLLAAGAPPARDTCADITRWLREGPVPQGHTRAQTCLRASCPRRLQTGQHLQRNRTYSLEGKRADFLLSSTLMELDSKTKPLPTLTLLPPHPAAFSFRLYLFTVHPHHSMAAPGCGVLGHVCTHPDPRPSPTLTHRPADTSRALHWVRQSGRKEPKPHAASPRSELLLTGALKLVFLGRLLSKPQTTRFPVPSQVSTHPATNLGPEVPHQLLWAPSPAEPWALPWKRSSMFQIKNKTKDQTISVTSCICDFHL